MTDIKLEVMDEQQQRKLARRLADISETYDFDTALRVVKARPEAAEEMLRDRERRKKLLDELARANERLHHAALELR